MTSQENTPTGVRSSTTRRDFLRTTALGAGLTLASSALGQDAAAPAAAPEQPAAAAPAQPAAPAPEAAPQPAAAPITTEMNVGVIGLGEQGTVLIEAMLRIPYVRIKAVCDIWDYKRTAMARRLKKLGHVVNDYVDYQELLANEKDKIQAVVVASPDFVHAEHSIAAMRAGYDVYCEKEMSHKVELARDMVLASKETGRLLQIGHQRRSNPRYIHAIDRLVHENKLLGRITHAYGQWNRAKSDDLGWPAKYAIDQATLEKYGYESMQHFRNWRWYRKYGGGPIVDLGSHQIDIFSWIFKSNPKSVMASGGVDFYKHHEWYDNVLCIFEYDSPEGIGRAFYQVLTTSSNGQFYENFLGENGSLTISEVAARGNQIGREKHAPQDQWDSMAAQGLVLKPAEPKIDPNAKKGKDTQVDVRDSGTPDAWTLPIVLNKPAHQPHLENFFEAIMFKKPLNCPAELGYETAVAVHKVNKAVEAATRLEFAPEEFHA